MALRRSGKKRAKREKMKRPWGVVKLDKKVEKREKGK